MYRVIFKILFTTVLLWNTTACYCQDSTRLVDKIFSFPDRVLRSIDRKSEKLQQDLRKSTSKYLSQLQRKERRLQRKLAKNDSARAQEMFGDVNKRYDSLRSILANPPNTLDKLYDGHLDSMATALKFLNQNNGISQTTGAKDALQNTFRQYGNLQSTFNGTNFIRNQLKERQQLLKDRLDALGLEKAFKKYQQKVYYYSAQIESYKNVWQQPKKMESLVLKNALRIPSFARFFNKYSQLASLFNLPGNDLPDIGVLNGLQTRSMIMQQLDQRLGSGINVDQFIQSSLANGQSQLNQIKNKISQIGEAGSGMEMPDFKPNIEKSKSLFKRIEFGTNIQSVRSTSFLPVTTDVGLSLGYKFSENAVAGIGGSYKVGWGTNIRHLKLTHQGAGLRSFVDWKLKKSFWLSGGFEMNYNSVFQHIDQLKNANSWQQSGLIGVSKKIQVKNKFVKNTKMQLLFDFLSYQQKPTATPIKFRVGYNF